MTLTMPSTIAASLGRLPTLVARLLHDACHSLSPAPLKPACCWRSAIFAALLAATQWSAAWAQNPPGSLSSPLAQLEEKPGAPLSSSQSAPPFEEEIPPFGKGNMLNEAQIRYCLAEFIRIEALRPVLNRYRSDQVVFFNALIAAFNSRCAKYRYELPAMESAKHDVESNRARIESDAQQAFLQRFRGPPKPLDEGVAAAPPEGQRPSSGPATAAQPTTPSAAQPLPAQAAPPPARPATQPQAAQQIEPAQAPASPPAAPPSGASPAQTPQPQVAQAPQPPVAQAEAPRRAAPTQTPAIEATPSTATRAEPPPPQVTPAPASPTVAATTPAGSPAPSTPAQPPQPQIAQTPTPAPAVSEAQPTQRETATTTPPPPSEPKPAAPAQVPQAATPAEPQPAAGATAEQRPPQPKPVAQTPPAVSQPKSSIAVPAQPQPKPVVQTPPAVSQPKSSIAVPAQPQPKPVAQMPPAAPQSSPSSPAPAAPPQASTQAPEAPAPEVSAQPQAATQAPETPAPEASVQTPAPTAAKEPATPASDRPKVALAAAKPSQAALAKDPALARFTRDVQRAGTRVIDKRRYPAQATGKNWAGKAQIEVQFAAGGYISRIVLAESCGHALLDEKALEVARSIMFPHVPRELTSREFSVRFPIEFRPGKG